MTIPFSTGVAPPLKPADHRGALRLGMDRARQHAEINQAVALISVKFLGRGNQAAIVNDCAQFLKDPSIHRIQSAGWKKIAPSMDEV